ncbi:FAD-dependent oxidoreductase [Streptomyces reniochalinae]|uniref:FAD-dependent oxidoreductase n=2 Tax=Streptomyces reniochalinae TaxID=2250578 RepID=A0A367E749_9ACTN|nr:FAD-dependent oxidoreductase [Streptomyces reniochalinae]
MLARELALQGASAVVLEKAPEPRTEPKANGLVGQIVELLHYRGLLDRFRPEAQFAGRVPAFTFGSVPLPLARLGDSPLQLLALPQPRLEALLTECAMERGVPIRRGCAVQGLAQDRDGVTVRLRGPVGEEHVRASYVVGCDGAHSTVRGLAGIEFPGTTKPDVTKIGHVTLPPEVVATDGNGLELPATGPLPLGWHHTDRGRIGVMSTRPGVHIVTVTENDPAGADPAAPLTLEELRSGVARVLGEDVPMTEAHWLSRVVNQSRLAARYRAGRVLLAGDAAHLFPAGGSSLNVGMTDAVNLGWKLAAVLRDGPGALLDTYHDERYPAAERTLAQTEGQAVMMASSEEAAALRELFAELVSHDAALRHIAELIHGSDIRHGQYGEHRADGQHGEGADADAHPLVGRLVPDLSFDAESGGPSGVAELLAEGRPVLLDLAGRTAVAEAGSRWAKRVEPVAARCAGAAPADALLIRPDGWVAWAPVPGETDAAVRAGLTRALRFWFGSPD